MVFIPKVSAISFIVFFCCLSSNTCASLGVSFVTSTVVLYGAGFSANSTSFGGVCDDGVSSALVQLSLRQD